MGNGSLPCARPSSVDKEMPSRYPAGHNPDRFFLVLGMLSVAHNVARTPSSTIEAV